MPPPRSVVQNWVFHTPMRMQAVLLSAIRGCDGKSKEDPSKAVVRALRRIILHNADPTNSFMKEELYNERVDAFVGDIDQYPVHFIMHLTHAAEIVGYKHPDHLIRGRWLDIYRKLVKALHLNPELENQLDVRLGYMPDELDAVETTRVAATTRQTAQKPPSATPEEMAKARAEAQAHRPIELDDYDAPSVHVAQEPTISPQPDCTCGHPHLQHYWFNANQTECSGGKCKCPKYAPKVAQAPIIAVRLTQPEVRHEHAVCICGHYRMSHDVPGPLHGTCTIQNCTCRAFRDRQEEQRRALIERQDIRYDAGTGTSHRNPRY